jgi:hypothetical protein
MVMTTKRGASRFGERVATGLVATAVVLCGWLAPLWGAPAPSVEKMLQFKPHQDGVIITTPEPDKYDSCKVELIKGPKGGSGWALKDAQGNLLRVFFAHDDKNVDMWSYYKDGKEVYREVDSASQGKPDQFRWLADGGMKWGVDETRSGKIKSWKVISPEEVCEEIVTALVNRDFARLQVLMITDAEMKTLDLPQAEVDRIHKAQKDAAGKFNETVAGMPKLNAKSTYQNLLTNGAPSCIPGDTFGGRNDLVKYTRATLVIDVNDKDHSTEMVQPGEMIQIGGAWRIIGAPIHGAADTNTAAGAGGTDMDNNPKLQALIQRLTEWDKKATTGNVGAAHHLGRADILEQIIAESKDSDREPWIRQVADSLSSAAQSSAPSDKTALTRLDRLVEQIVRAIPGSNLAAYATFRQLQAEYSVKISAPGPDFNKIQTEWVDTLSKFVATYPKADDTPDAMLQLGMVNEFLNKEVEAKNWYNQLVKNAPESKQAVKAAGAIRRLELDGQPVKIVGPTLKDLNVPFDSEQLRNKVVIVYYWASWNSQSVGDFAKLKLFLEGNKEVELVAINLDSDEPNGEKGADRARAFLAKSPAPGTHLHQQGGLEGKLALDYGVMVLPQLFLVGKDGKCLSHTVQVSNIEEEIKKATEKK